MANDKEEGVWSLLAEARRLRKTDINGDAYPRTRARKFGIVVQFLLPFLVIYWLGKGFSDQFVSYSAAILSILVGLFINALVFSLDKFYTPNGKKSPNSIEKIWDNQGFTYTRKFAYITGSTIVLSVLTLLVLSPSALFPSETNVDVFKLEWAAEYSRDSVFLFLLALALIVQRFVVLVLMLQVMVDTLYIVCSMVHYMAAKLERPNAN